MAIMEISVIPIGTQNPSVSSFVAECVKILDREGLQHEITSMGTEVEGEVEELLRLAGEMHRIPFQKRVQRVVTTIRIDDRRDKELSIAGKKNAVFKRMGKQRGGQ
jgi:uncharacterized protein (TIGR00106 family)